MDKEDWQVTKGIIAAVFVCITLVWGFCALAKIYNVWSMRKSGEAELAHAEANRQIKTLEAKAFEDSAKHLAAAEITRAHGVAEANKIIGQSLKDNEGYLRYLWITSLQTSQKEIVYIPTEANMPILEAGKR